jgi:hypothetical protein
VKPEELAVPRLTAPSVKVPPPVRLLAIISLAVNVVAPFNVRLSAPETVRAPVRETVLDRANAAALLTFKVPAKLSKPLARPPSLAVVFDSSSVPPVRVVAPAEAFVPVMFKIPAFTEVVPLYVFAPDKIQVPAPDLVMARFPPPEPSPTTPLTVLAPVFVPVSVRVVVPVAAAPVTEPPISSTSAVGVAPLEKLYAEAAAPPMISGALTVSGLATVETVEIEPFVARVSELPPAVPMVKAPVPAPVNEMLAALLAADKVTFVFTLLLKVALLVELGIPALQVPLVFQSAEDAPLQVSVVMARAEGLKHETMATTPSIRSTRWEATIFLASVKEMRRLFFMGWSINA